ncbi:MAG TPA: pseudouridine synthase [Parasegetibacter sp.]
MSKQNPFDKFINKKKGSVIKEEIRQSKKIDKKERAAEYEKRKQEKLLLKKGGNSSEKPGHYLRTPDQSNPDKSGKSTLVNKGKSGAKRTEADRNAAPLGSNRIANTERPKIEKRIAAQSPKPSSSGSAHSPASASAASKAEKMPLNKYIAHSGLCSRRDAAELVKKGVVTVNDVKVDDPGTKVTDTDTVKVNGKKVVPSKHLVYILLNKPKDYITTVEDPQGRKTVLSLIKNATNERVYPVGRLDRNTSGVLLITNDGDLAQMLSHPKYGVKKVYSVGLDRPLTKADFEKILNGVTLDDGPVMVDALAYTEPHDKSVVGIEIHSGRNRVVRRLFEKLGYDVKTLDRVVYAGLTKKDVPRGKWRFLTPAEVRTLKYYNKAGKKQLKTDADF